MHYIKRWRKRLSSAGEPIYFKGNLPLTVMEKLSGPQFSRDAETALLIYHNFAVLRGMSLSFVLRFVLGSRHKNSRILYIDVNPY